jgi:hypothetical protein
MDELYKKNINLIKNSDIIINDTLCNYFLRKDGKFVYKSINKYNEYMCIINDKKYYKILSFPFLNDYTEDRIIKKLIILNYLKQNNIKYIKYTNNYIDTPDNYIIIFKDEYKDRALNHLFFDSFDFMDKKNVKNNSPELIKYIYNNGDLLTNILTVDFMLYKYQFKEIKNNKVLVYVFYEYYINFIKEELYKKYGKTLNSFSNYNNLYIFLKEKGYVDKFYNDYAPVIIKNYKLFYKKLINDPLNEKYRKKILKNIKTFTNIDLLKLVDKHVTNKLNKTYIKNKFIELTQKI